MNKYDLNCSLIILYCKDEILLQKRTVDAPVLANYWAFFGGGIEKDETPQIAVIREVKEELGYKLVSPTLLLEQKFYLEKKSGYMFVYIDEIKCAKESISCFEGEKLGWFKKEDIIRLKMLNHDKEIAYKVFQKMMIV